MRTNSTPLLWHALLLAWSTTLAGCGAFGSDGERYEKLDRLRVLAIRSEPPDLAVGETATLSANVYEPAGRDLSYEWSWCPSRGGSTTDFECNVSERDLQRAWTAAGLDGSPPSYDLGAEPEVQFTNLLAPALVTALCEAQGRDQRIAAACFAGLEASVQLTVRSSEAELTALKSVKLLLDESSERPRNDNPDSDFTLAVLDNEGDNALEGDQPLRAGHRYTMVAGVDDAVAESFTPEAKADEPQPRERRETLTLSWFATSGEIKAPKGREDGGLGDENARTTFVDGSNDVADLARNGWYIPLNAGSRAELHLVLRDERGGVGWTARSFDVIGGTK